VIGLFQFSESAGENFENRSMFDEVIITLKGTFIRNHVTVFTSAYGIK